MNGQTDSDTDHEGPAGEVKRVESFAELIGGWFWETDKNHRFCYMSESVETITGVRPEWHYGKSRQDLGAPASVDPQEWERHLAILEAREPFQNFIFQREGPDGLKWMQTSGNPIFDDTGEFLGYRGIASDITAQVEAERNMALLASAIEQLSDMFALWGPDDRLLLCNRRFREINQVVAETSKPGVKFEDHIRAALEAGLYVDAVAREEEWLAERMEHHRNPSGLFEIERQDGIWILLNEQRLPNGATVTISSDITEVKQSQAKAQEQANIVETSMRAMPDGMLILDDDLEFVSWNDRLFEILGLNADLIVGSESPAKTFRYMMGQRGEYGTGDIDSLVAEHEAMLRQSEANIRERQLSNGRWVEIRNYPIPTGGYIYIVRDFTEQHAMARMKDEFISTVSHELRTPMTSILGSIGLLAGGTFGELQPQAGDLLRIANDNGQRLLTLINDLLEVEKLASGNMEYRMERIGIDELLSDAMDANKGYAEQFEVNLVLRRSDIDAKVYGDKVRLLQVMANLISNAVKYSATESDVDISPEMVGDTVRISVIDRGEGIPLDYHSQVFEKFTRADSSNTRQVGGTGLGLSICKAIVEHHGGRIGFESEPGIGSTFYFELDIDRTVD